MILLNQRFPACTLCGKRIPLRTEPILIGARLFCSHRCVELAARRDRDRPEGSAAATGTAPTGGPA